ncbi:MULTISPECIES: chromate efflux transporter [Cobetia]|uniref:chromate efflux transporter n=1 Tax=Cobetia TaxID=204286 RepID=UPI0015840471|nr:MULTISPECIES: chromate efflux transporter [Cobetia]MDI4660866.1 chromate efflux transporter [Cobetia sp. BMC6]NUJ56995.1 chromate efflux transporter [Cobetia marina]NVN56168.1 chromate efflux transporter [bacterium Scap17]
MSHPDETARRERDPATPDAPLASDKTRRSEVLRTFFTLGLTSFGGPIAHLGYFHDELVRRRGWLSDKAYAELVALCQFLPGPASSQVGFALGMVRGGGVMGGLLAWIGFTLPSALALLVLALVAGSLEGPLASGVIHGLKLVAVAVVAQAIWGMARKLCPDLRRTCLALLAMLGLALAQSAWTQVGVIAMGAVLGSLLCRDDKAASVRQQAQAAGLSLPVSPRLARYCLIAFFVLLIGLPLVASGSLVDIFYRAGALVFGGGHVVLPLLEASTVETGHIAADTFLTGYGAAQAVPGPLFTFAAWLGAGMAQVDGGSALLGAVIALLSIFLPGILLLIGVAPLWGRLRARAGARAALAGANAAVVGVLGMALYDPLWTTSVLSRMDMVIALAAFIALTRFSLAPWKLVLGMVILGALRGVI